MRKAPLLLLWSGIVALSGCSERVVLMRPGSPDQTLPVIVHVQTRHEVLTALASPDGPVYTVRTRDGRMLGERLSEQELQAQLPHIHRFLKSSYADGEPGSVIWSDTLTPGPQE